MADSVLRIITYYSENDYGLHPLRCRFLWGRRSVPQGRNKITERYKYMKSAKKCGDTQNRNDTLKYRRWRSVGMFFTSSADAASSLINVWDGSCRRMFPHVAKAPWGSPKLRHPSHVLMSVLVLSIVALLSTMNSNDVSATASSLTVSVADNIGIDILASGSTGTFVHSDTSANNVSVSTTNGTGYTLGIKASSTTSGNALKNTSDNTKTIPSITTSVSESDFSSSSSYNNMWGYRPSKINSSSNSNYLQAPASSDTVTTLDATTAANSTANTYNIAIGARVNNTTTSGTYSNTFTITTIANPIPYTIYYNANAGSDTVSDMPSNENKSSYSETVNVSSNEPSRSGYTFAGWCTVAVNADASCTGTSYAKGGSWTLNQTSTSNSLTLYARWTINSYTCTQQYRLQNADGSYPSSYTSDGTKSVKFGSTCSYTKSASYYSSATGTCTMVVGGCTARASLPRTTYALTINRNTTYISSVSGAGTYRWGQSISISATTASGGTFNGWSVSSGSTGTFASASSASTTYTMPQGASTIYADGKSSKLWFQNATSANCGSTMYDNRGTDTYKNVAYTTAKIGSLCWMTRNLDLPGGTALTSSDTNLSTGFTLPASSTSGFSSYNTDYVYNSGRTSCSSSSSCYSYYSFYTATAHWGTNSVSSGSSSVDICPKGWRLPTQAEYNTLIGTYTTGSTLTASPWLGVYSGYYYNGSFYNGGSYGYYWSSTVSSSYYAYRLYFDSSSAGVGYDNKFGGFAIRCVAKS